MAEAKVAAAPLGWFDRWLERRQAKKLEQATQTIEDGKRSFERLRQFEEKIDLFNAAPPKELLESALEAAGLPKDISKIQDRWCVFSLPRGGLSQKECLTARIEGVDLKDGILHVSVSYGPYDDKLPGICFKDNRWWTWKVAGEFSAEYPVHDFELL